MMTRSFIITCLVATTVFAQSPTPAHRDVPVTLRMPESHISDIVKLYQSLTKRKVWIDAELRFDRRVSIVTEHVVPRAEAISLIRDALRKEGIEIREVGDTEAYVSRASP